MGRLIHLAIVAFIAIPCWIGTAVAADSCEMTVGLDTTRADASSGSTTLGSAVGQSFLAPTSSIRSITVWRVWQQDSLLFGLRLFVCKVDSTGVPITSSPILNGELLTVPFGDGIHPQAFRFSFDPPLVLPGPGQYCFFIQVDPCIAWSDILADEDNEFADGELWRTARSLSCSLRPSPTRIAQSDLCFEIEFCDAATPTKRSSWGEVKARYR